MPKDPLLGRQLANFAVERLLGRGGMARVYYGQDVKLERPVAIKVFDFQYQDDPAYAERFVREARAVAAWRHENIVQVYYADDQEGFYYFVMEYIDGLDLGELLLEYADAGGLMPHDQVLVIGRAVASALDYAHQEGVIHRDVKPANVMVAEGERVILTDFGLALDVHRGSVGEVSGSAHYIAPEQARSSANAVPQSDLYSLGVILYQMLTGEVPFDDPSPTSVALQHLTMPPRRPREINPELNEETEAVLLKALSKPPEDRYQTGGELMDALEEALHAGQSAPVDSDELVPLPADDADVFARRETRSLHKTSVGERVSSHLARESPAAQPDASLLGLQLGEYRLEALLGQGGMARVYRGVDVNLDRRVAIKVIDTPFRTDSDYVARFKREAQAIARLEHPHIVRLYRYGEAEGLLYMAMQYVEGSDLDSVLADCRTHQIFVEPKEASRIVREICLALDYAHSQGVIHRDVKPSNIMLDEQWNAILADFGLALLTEHGTQGEIFGSPRYIAPEQAISSANAVPQSDLYAVGVILYEMFVGQPPFDAEDPLDEAMLRVIEPPRPPRESRPEISPELEEVILKALAREPEQRYQSGVELADALDRALEIATAQAPSSLDEAVPYLPPPEPVASAERMERPPIPAPVQRAEEAAVSTLAGPTPSVPPRKRKASILYVFLVIVACILVTTVSGAVLLLTNGSAKEWVQQALMSKPATREVESPGLESKSPIFESPLSATAVASVDVTTTVTRTTVPTSTGAVDATATLTVEPTAVHTAEKPVLEIAKFVSPDRAKQGGELVYTIRVGGKGRQATNVVITDTIPTDTEYVKDSATGGGRLDGGKVYWTIPVLEPGAVHTFKFSVIVQGGDQIVNERYAAKCDEGVVVVGTLVVTLVDRGKSVIYMPLVFKNAP